jgi:chemotaxis methyl-accepting protein methylase
MNSVEHATVLLRSRAGLKAEPSSRARIERLLEEGANLSGIAVESYVDRVEAEPAAFADLLDKVTVQHSSFFRDPAQFVALAELVLESTDENHVIWCAGCGNGQEPYSLAMMLEETGHRNWSIVATDVSFHALARAEKAVYSEREVQGLSADRLERYLRPVGGGYEVAPYLRRNVRVTHHNLAREEAGALIPESAVVFCRNVLMYFGRMETDACIRRLAGRLAPGGHLFLGHSDSPGRMTGYFEQVHVAGTLCYRRIAATTPAEKPALRPQAARRQGRGLPGLMADGELAAAAGDLRAAIRAFRQATYLDPNVAIAYFQLGAALELAGDQRESRRAFAAAGLAMMREEGDEDLAGLGGYTRRDLARAIAFKLSAEVA